MSGPLDAAVRETCDRALAVRWDDLEGATRDAALRAVLDALGVAGGGTAAPGVRRTLDALARVGGGPVPGGVDVPWAGVRLAPAEAAMALSLLIHAWDFDDTHDSAVVHSCTVAVPAAYATACATGASGRRFLEGVVAGIEVVCRLSLALGPQRGVIRTAGLASVGAAAAAARVLGLGPEPGRAALSLGAPLALAPTSRQVVADGAITKRHQPGFGVRHGVTAAFLAEAGIAGAPGWFAGTYGLGALVGDEAAAATALGRPGWEATRLSLKPYPACRYTHAAVAGTLRLTAEALPASQVASARVSVPAGSAHVLVARPWERRGQPIIDAQFSIPWLVGAALERGGVHLGVLSGPDLLDEAIEARARRVDVVQEETADASGMTPVTVELVGRDGATHRADVRSAPGSPEDPLDLDAIVAKVAGCLRAAGRPADLASALRAAVTGLEGSDLRGALSPFDGTAAAAATPRLPATAEKEHAPWTSA